MKFIGDFDATLEDYITSLPAVTSIGAASATTDIAAGDITMYNAVNDGNPTISLGKDSADRAEFMAEYHSGAQTFNRLRIKTYSSSSATNAGRITFYVDETTMGEFRDSGLNIPSDKSFSIGGTNILADTGGSTTLSNIDALDATTEATIESAIDTLGNLTSASSLETVGTITSGTWRGTAIEMDSGGTGLVGATDGKIVVADGSGGPVHLDIGSSTAITTLGTISTGTWQGTAIASAYLDADTAHYSATRQVTHHMILDDLDSDVIYISLGEIDQENTSATSKHLPLIAPSSGKLLKIFLRTSVNQSSETFTWKLYTRSTSVSTGGAASEIASVEGAGPTNQTMVTYDFTTGLDSGTNAINAGDKVQISIEAADGSTANGSYFITCLWEWDLS